MKKSYNFWHVKIIRVAIIEKMLFFQVVSLQLTLCDTFMLDFS